MLIMKKYIVFVFACMALGFAQAQQRATVTVHAAQPGAKV
jgi:hypothetical protein